MAVCTASGVSDVGYYTGAGGEAPNAVNYYLDAATDGEPPGVWNGTGAAILGLSGDVVDDDMRTLFNECVNPVNGDVVGNAPRRASTYDVKVAEALAAEPDALPERIEAIRARLEKQCRPPKLGWDLTLSVPKSVTVAWTAARRAEIAATRSGDLDRIEEYRSIRLGIESAIDEGNRAMLDRVEQVMVTRVGRHGGKGTDGRWAKAPHIVAASFFQHTNRNIDPQLHVHNVILNRVMTDDGRWLAIDADDLLPQQHMFGAVGGRVLEERLAAMGFEFARREDGVGRELVVVPASLCDRWSSRDEQVTRQQGVLVDAMRERLGREPTDLEKGRMKRLANQMTREGKHSSDAETVEEMFSRWEAESSAEGKSLDAIAEEIVAHLGMEHAGPETWSPEDTIAQALETVAGQESSWLWSDLHAEIENRLPTLGVSPAEALEVVDRLTDQAIASGDVVQVSGLSDVAPWQDTPVEDDTRKPTAVRYATTGTLKAEEHLRQAAVTRGRRCVDADQVHEWLTEHTPTIGEDQRAVVAGIAASDAELAVLVGPAGAGKSFAMGALAGAWGELTGGRVIGLATSQAATDVLKDDGLEWAMNTSMFRIVQDKIRKNPFCDSAVWALSKDDLVVIDESSMVSRKDVDMVRRAVTSAGARLLLAGDPRQLGSVDAGGVMGLLEDHAETYTLDEVRRFRNENGRVRRWEQQASLKLRDGDARVLDDYKRHGRLRGYDTVEQAMSSAAAAAVADRVAGRSTVIVASSVAEAGKVSCMVRDRLVALGKVQADGGVLLGRDGNTAAVGDLISARRNDWRLGLTNRVQYEVQEVHDDGSLTVRALADLGAVQGSDAARGGQTRHVPSQYVKDHTQLGYASTVHGAQGITVHAAHVVTKGGMDSRSLYVAMTRGAHSNVAHVATTSTPAEDPLVHQVPRGAVVDGDVKSESARAVLASSMDRDEDGKAALVVAEDDRARLDSADHLLGRIEGLTKEACRTRLERHLDELVSDGLLDSADRARLRTEQATASLSRVLRAVELAGRDPREELREAVAAGRLGVKATEVSKVLIARVNPSRHAPAPSMDAQLVPAGIDTEHARVLDWLHGRVGDRAAVLGADAVKERPAWAIEHLGPVPEDDGAREQWAMRAGVVAVHREATGYDDPYRPLGAMPAGTMSTERRASYTAAWEALGRPEDTLDTSTWTEGQIRSWVRAGKDAERWAPAVVDPALQAAEVIRADASTTADTLAAEADHLEETDQARAEELRALAEQHRATVQVQSTAVEELTTQAEARDSWYAASLPTLHMRDRAMREAQERGLRVGDEPDRTTAAEWLEAERTARVEDDAHRVVTDADVADEHAHGHDAQAPADLACLPESVAPTDRGPGFARTVVGSVSSAWLRNVNAVAARLAAERAADALSQDEHVPASDRWQRWIVAEDNSGPVADSDRAAEAGAEQ